MAAWMILELTAADPGLAIETIASEEIPLHDVEYRSALSFVCRIDRMDYGKIQKLSERKGWKLRTIKRKGIAFRIRDLGKRPVLVLFCAFLAVASLILQGKILKVEVEGNHLIPDNRILEAAGECGICFWADRREVRSEKVKNSLLGALPELQWAGVNTYGSRAVITVRERSPETEQTNDFGVSSLAASRDGVILSLVATRGNCLVSPGQAVSEGDILISGIVNLENTVRLTRAEGEVFARTRRNLTVKTPDQVARRTVQVRTSEKICLILGKKRINFYKGSGISDGSCVKMYSKYVLTLPGGFELPVTVMKETSLSYELTYVRLDESAIFEELSEFAGRYLKQQMIAGVIIHDDEHLSFRGGWVLDGFYECQEMIGRVKPEEIGVHNGKTD